ncbi:hypothetical protein MHB44_20585 [Lysinibacillus sp. FSL H8-0500]|uniref:hypothetical protein n=1 Tax=Lysinibacillus sp. FSL H8-0500 TaxID=2921393 RepID=UPI0031014CBF
MVTLCIFRCNSLHFSLAKYTSKKTLKELKKLLNIRDITIREIFNSLGYFYNKSQHEWQHDAKYPDTDMIFNEVLVQLKAAASKKTPEVNSKLIGVNKGLIEAKTVIEKEISNSKKIACSN